MVTPVRSPPMKASEGCAIMIPRIVSPSYPPIGPLWVLCHEHRLSTKEQLMRVLATAPPRLHPSRLLENETRLTIPGARATLWELRPDGRPAEQGEEIPALHSI